MINFTINPMTTIIIANRTINCHPLKAASNIHATSGTAPNHIITSTIRPSPPAIHNNLPITLNSSPIVASLPFCWTFHFGSCIQREKAGSLRTPLRTERRYKIISFLILSRCLSIHLKSCYLRENKEKGACISSSWIF